MHQACYLKEPGNNSILTQTSFIMGYSPHSHIRKLGYWMKTLLEVMANIISCVLRYFGKNSLRILFTSQPPQISSSKIPFPLSNSCSWQQQVRVSDFLADRVTWDYYQRGANSGALCEVLQCCSHQGRPLLGKILKAEVCLREEERFPLSPVIS